MGAMCFVGFVCLEVVGSAAGVVRRAWGVAQSFVGGGSVSVDLLRCCCNQVSSFFVEFGSTDMCMNISAVQALREKYLCLSQCCSNSGTRTTLAREGIYESRFLHSRSHWPRGPAGDRLLGLRVRNPPGVWISVYCV
jgi:hypothetical protein